MKKPIYDLNSFKLFTIFLFAIFLSGDIYANIGFANSLRTTSTGNEILFQTITIKGTVTDNLGTPLGGVNVIVEGTTRGVLTNFDGEYEIEAEKGEVLVFSFLGMKTTTVTIENSSTINVSLEEDASLLEEVVYCF